ncbi:MAG: hypothetical protein CMI54_04010 [Parcubacteria group bacterium]|nr:hypothetical protein [Parcubacteria group bacterium]|tara:strand:+ start:238 stop:1884 length:1647 start_codon:yes stop_codon:yes gene_type:complete
MSTTSSSVKSRVEDLVGEIQDDATAITQWASDTAREVINLLPQDMLWSVSTTKSDGGGGTGAVVAVTVTNEVITAASVTTAGSGYLSDPEITVTDASGSGAEIRGFSDGGALIAVDLVTGGTGYSASPTITVSSGGGVSVTTAKFLYAEKNGYQATEIDASNKARATDSGSIYNATVKSPVYYREGGKIFVEPDGGGVHVVDYPTIAYGNSGVTGVPDDVEHLVIMGAAVKARIGQLVLLRVGIAEIDSPTFTEVELVLDAIPSITDFSISESAPTLVLEASPSITDLTISASAPTSPVSPSFTDNVVTLPASPSYTPPVTDLSFASADTFITTNEDVELANAELQKVSTQINKFQADIQNQVQKFNEVNVVYQAGVQKAIQDAQLDSSKDTRQYESDLRRYHEEVLKYQQLVNTEVQEYTLNRLQKDLSIWAQKRSSQLQQYIADLDRFKAITSNEKEVYAINELQKEIGLYQASQNHRLQKYQGDLSKKGQKFQAEFGVWQTDVASEFQKHQAMMGELAALQGQYREGLQNFVASYRLPKGEKDGE